MFKTDQSGIAIDAGGANFKCLVSEVLNVIGNRAKKSPGQKLDRPA